jgi:NADPH:quinone reductase-like Zn-dependent oxidoreductase
VRAFRFHEYGGLDVLRLDKGPDPVPGDGEALHARRHPPRRDRARERSRERCLERGHQVAKIAGARVIASAGSDAKLTRAREFGADEFVNYGDQPLAETVLRLTDGRGVDLVVEHAGGHLFGDSMRALRSDSRLVTCGGHEKLQPVVDSVFPLEEAREPRQG